MQSLVVSQNQAKAELARRELSRRNLLNFTEYTNPIYERAKHHKLICKKLEAVERGEIDRLMIFMPPRHGKSELASKRFPAWCLGRDPNRQIIASSYNSDLASDFGRNVRNIIAEPEFGNIFPNVSLASDSKAANRMNTNMGGAYIAAGVGTAITGRGANIALIDDPFKDREEADSERRRNLVWDWYRSTLFTRLMPNGAIVLIQTRWHEDDLAGRLLEHEADQWDILDLPAISDDNQPLWPEWYDLDSLNRIKETIGPREWSALYQQKPQPDEGTYFQRDWLKYWDKLPAVRYYGTSDYAVTEGGGDYTVHRVWGVDASGAIYRVDGWRGQTTPDIWIEEKLNLIDKYKPLAWFGEAGVIKKAVDPMLQRRMRERRIFCRMEWIASVSDKASRARAFQSRAAMGLVFFEQGADVSEYLSFPVGKHDDDVDTGSMIGLVLDQAHPAIVEDKRNSNERDAWDRAFEDEEEAEWKVI
jgi:predicted phage terminase large subunit-like protein